MRDVVMVGAGMIKFGRYPEKGVHELAAQAALLAMQDAGVTMKDIELLASGNLYQASAMIGQRILKEIGQTGIPVINVANACATGSTAFREADVLSVSCPLNDQTRGLVNAERLAVMQTRLDGAVEGREAELTRELAAVGLELETMRGGLSNARRRMIELEGEIEALRAAAG